MAIIMKLLGNGLALVLMMDVCRWYQDYRNAKTAHSARKQLLLQDIFAHAAWASRMLDLLE